MEKVDCQSLELRSDAGKTRCTSISELQLGNGHVIASLAHLLLVNPGEHLVVWNKISNEPVCSFTVTTVEVLPVMKLIGKLL